MGCVGEEWIVSESDGFDDEFYTFFLFPFLCDDSGYFTLWVSVGRDWIRAFFA